MLISIASCFLKKTYSTKQGVLTMLLFDVVNSKKILMYRKWHKHTCWNMTLNLIFWARQQPWKPYISLRFIWIGMQLPDICLLVMLLFKNNLRIYIFQRLFKGQYEKRKLLFRGSRDKGRLGQFNINECVWEFLLILTV